MSDKEITALIQAGDAALLSTISTADLVRELCSREGNDFYNLSIDERVTVEDLEDCGLNFVRDGPARIIVMRGCE